MTLVRYIATTAIVLLHATATAAAADSKTKAIKAVAAQRPEYWAPKGFKPDEREYLHDCKNAGGECAHDKMFAYMADFNCGEYDFECRCSTYSKFMLEASSCGEECYPHYDASRLENVCSSSLKMWGRHLNSTKEKEDQKPVLHHKPTRPMRADVEWGPPPVEKNKAFENQATSNKGNWVARLMSVGFHFPSVKPLEWYLDNVSVPWTIGLIFILGSSALILWQPPRTELVVVRFPQLV